MCDANLELKYIGAISLIGRLARKCKDIDSRYEIEAAIQDFSKSTETGKRFDVVPDSLGGYTLEPRS